MTDWPAIIGPVAVALLGEPSRRSGRELRYGRKGSLSVHLDKGTWHDHESATGGGVLDLVKRDRGCDTAGAMEWLESGGFVESRDRDRPMRTTSCVDHERTLRTPKPPQPADTGPDPRAALVAQLWACTVPADATPGRLYLALRFAWPPHGIGPNLPTTVRWLAHEASPGSNRAAKWYGLPEGAAGALTFAWWRPGDEDDPDPRAVSLVAVSTTGERVPWFGRGAKILEVGQRTGAVFTAREVDTTDAPLLACEGEINALALSLSPWAEPGRVVSVGPAGNMSVVTVGGRDVILFADDDTAGRKAALKASRAVRDLGRRASIRFCVGDPNNELDEDLIERAAIREFDGGATREEAERCAWIDLLNRD